MAQQALVIGLGQFGMSIAKSLTVKGVEVLAVDQDKDLVGLASAFAVEAMQFDVTDADSLIQTLPRERDFSVCAIGDDSKESSIICTALLRQHGSPRVVARACNPVHARILSLVGAHVVVNPEEEFGQRLANRLLYGKVINDMPLGNDLLITEFAIPEKYAGRTLMDLALPKRFDILVVAVRHGASDTIGLPDPTTKLQANDNLIVVSKESAIAKLMESAKS